MAAPLLAKELSLTPAQLGLLFSAFFWSYAGFMIAAGWITDHLKVSLVLGIGYFIWSVATLGTGLVSNFAALLALRVLLGLGESVAYPVFSRVIANGFPANARALPNALIDLGVKIGPAIGLLLGGLLVARAGWRSLFLVLGAGGMLWLIPWCIWAPRTGGAVEKMPAGGPSLWDILRRRDAWGTFVGNFGCNYGYYFLMTWLPSYLVTERHVSLDQMAVLGSLPMWGSAVASLTGAWAADRWISRGANPTVVRKAFVVTGLAGSALILPAGMVSDLRTSMILIMLTYVAFGLVSSNHWAITQTLAGPLAAGTWTGLQNCMANLAGVIAPFGTGLVVAKTGSFFLAFFSSAVIALIGSASYLFVVQTVEPLSWKAGRGQESKL
jgi:MFS family permease